MSLSSYPYSLVDVPREVLITEILQYKHAKSYRENAAPFLVMSVLRYVSRALRDLVQDTWEEDLFGPMNYFFDYELPILYGNDSIAFFEWYAGNLFLDPLVTFHSEQDQSSFCDYFYADVDRDPRHKWDRVAELACAFEQWTLFEYLMRLYVSLDHRSQPVQLVAGLTAGSIYHGSYIDWTLKTDSVCKRWLSNRWKPDIRLTLAIALASSKNPDGAHDSIQAGQGYAVPIMDTVCGDRRKLAIFHRRALACNNIPALCLLFENVHTDISVAHLHEFYAPGHMRMFDLPNSHLDPFYCVLTENIRGFCPSPHHVEAAMLRHDFNEMAYRAKQLDQWVKTPSFPVDFQFEWMINYHPHLFTTYLPVCVDKQILRWLFDRMCKRFKHVTEKITREVQSAMRMGQLHLDDEMLSFLKEELMLPLE